MAGQRHSDDGIHAQVTGGALKRRGLIAGAAAVAVGVLARQSAQTVEAAYSLLGDTTNTSSTTTTITGSVLDAPVLTLTNTNTGQGFPDALHTNTTDGISILAQSTNQTGVYSIGFNGVIGIAANASGVGMLASNLSTGDGLHAFAGNGSFARGIYGTSMSSTGAGVTGDSPFAGMNGSGKVYGILASSDGNTGIALNAYASKPGGMGIFAESVGIYGIYGQSAAAGGVGVTGTCTGGIGVLGTVSDGYGLYGAANTGIGIYGSSAHKHGIQGTTTAAYFGAVYGQTTTTNTVGVYGSTFNGVSNIATAYAGYMDGNFAVVHGVKSAGVPHPDGTYRLLYCVESPENWFEDFGTGTLVGGRADIKLDPDFAAVVHADDYHVFLTEHDVHQHLIVTKRTATGFSVQADTEIAALKGKKAADLAGTFSWRLVAKRKDITPERLAKFTLPVGREGRHAGPMSLPKPPQAPKPPEFPAVTAPTLVKKP
jgi:hypothetical protein